MLNRDSTPPKAQRVIIAAFLSTTIVLAILTVYTVYIYFQMFSAVRTFSVKINELTFNASNATLKTTVSIQNPSQAPFDVLYVEEWVAVGGIFIRNTGVYMQNHPLKLSPNGNLTIPIEADVSTKIPEITTRLKQNWQVQIRFSLRGFLVGEFFHEEWFTTPITE